MTAAVDLDDVPDCGDECARTRATAARLRTWAVCNCLKVHRAPPPPPPARVLAPLAPEDWRRWKLATRRPRLAPPPRVQAWASDPEAWPAPPSALDRAAREAQRGDDPETAYVRRLLKALRPDYVDPFAPLPKAAPSTSPYAPQVRTPEANWGGIPRGVGRRGDALDDGWDSVGRESARAVQERIDALPPDAAAACAWLREHATLAQGLRGLYHEAGMQFASDAQREAWRDLGLRRDGAHKHGHFVVHGAARAWGIK